MSVPAFGYSAGDFIATIELIFKVISAFKDGSGASAEYRQILHELESVLHLLQHISTLATTERNFAYVNAIKGVALNLQAPLRKFLDKIGKRYGPLSGTPDQGTVSALVAAGRKVQWAVVMEKDIGKLRAVVGANVSSILLLLNMNHLDAASFIEKLAKDNQADLLHSNAEIRQELVSQRTSTDRRFLQQLDLISGVRGDIGDLSSVSKATAGRVGIMEQQQKKDSAALMNFLEFMKAMVLSLKSVMPMIYDFMCKMMLSNVHLYAMLVAIQSSVSQMPTMLLSDNIHFEDVLGRVRSLPYQSFRYWKVFRAFLECEFEGLPGEQNILRGRFHIANAKFENRLIGEQEWNQGVFPGMRLNMSVIIESFRRKRGLCPRKQCMGVSQVCGGSSPFFVCSQCGVRFTEIPESVQAKIIEVESAQDVPPQPVQRKSTVVIGRPKPAPRSTAQEGETWTERLKRRQNLAMAAQEMKARETSDIFNFRRIHISTSEDLDAALKTSVYDSTTQEGELTQLQTAARSGNIILARLLIEDGVNIEELGGMGFAVLHHTIGFNQYKLSQLYMSMVKPESEGEQLMPSSTEERPRGAEECLHMTLAEWKTEVELAVERGNRDVMVSLLKSGVNMIMQLGTDGVGFEGEAHQGVPLLVWETSNKEAERFLWATLLEWRTRVELVIERRDRRMAQLLLASGADIEAVREAGLTMLHRAAAFGDHQMLELLLASGANIEAVTEGGLTALHSATKRGDEKTIQFLLASGANIEAVCERGCTALHIAALTGQVKIVQLLLESGANVGAIANTGSTVLHVAVMRGDQQVVQLLLASGVDIEAECEAGFTALLVASVGGLEEMVKILLRSGAHIDHESKTGLTALHGASMREQGRVIELLLSHGANIEVLGSGGFTALGCAVSQNLEHMVKLLLAKGANIEVVGPAGFTALGCAVSRNLEHMVKLLLAMGANIDVVGPRGCTGLHLAVIHNHESIAELLVAGGANIQAIYSGCTPLEFAFYRGRERIVQLLLENGATMKGLKHRRRRNRTGAPR